ncbi:MAG: GNAT family N-acetyltransferase [Pirellulales bacterium]
MPRILASDSFSSNHADLVKGFYCGSDSWAVAASDWIQASESDQFGVFRSIKRGTNVWLYFDPDDVLVGFGSLGLTKWPNFDGAVAIIPQMAIACKFQGEPKGIDETRYSHQILGDLIARARSLKAVRLVLTVHPGNARAKSLYLSHGFQELSDVTALGHLKMIAPLGQ